MKKLIAILCAAAMLASTTTVAFGAEVVSPPSQEVDPFAPDQESVEQGTGDDGTQSGGATDDNNSAPQTPGGTITTGGALGTVDGSDTGSDTPTAPLGGALIDADGKPIPTEGNADAPDFSALGDRPYVQGSVLMNGTDQAIIDKILDHIKQGAAIVVVEAKKDEYGEKVIDEEGKEHRELEPDSFILVDILSDTAAHTTAELFDLLNVPKDEITERGTENKHPREKCGVISLGYAVKLLVGGQLYDLPEGNVTVSFPGSQLTKDAPKKSILAMSTRKPDENGNKQAPEFSPCDVSEEPVKNIITVTLNAAQPFCLIKDDSIKKPAAETPAETETAAGAEA